MVLKVKKIKPYYNMDKTMIAVLVSPGYGAGWSTWTKDEFAWDSRIVKWWLKHHTDEDYARKITDAGFGNTNESQEHKEFLKFLEDCGYENVDEIYLGGYKDIELVWVPRNRKWLIKEYDGSEKIVFADEQKWHAF